MTSFIEPFRYIPVEGAQAGNMLSDKIQKISRIKIV